MKPDIRLVVSDLDGTLLNPEGVITARTAKAVSALRDRGVAFAACTGRFPENAAAALAEGGLSCPVISLNGAVVELAPPQGRIFEQLMDPRAAMLVFQTLEQLGEGYHIFAPGKVVSRRQTHLHHSELGREKGHPLTRNVRYSYGEEACRQAAGEPLYKFYVYFTPQSQPPEAIRAALGGIAGAALTQSGESNVELISDQADKGTGLHILAERLGVAPGHIMALGDQLNDLPMLRYAGLGVAMGNAPDTVKEAASFVTGSNREDGAAAAIETFCL